MLRCCETFALNHGLSFNASKTQLIRFSSSPSSSCAAHIYFCGIELPFLDTVLHLGHLLHYNLSDTPDINLKLKDMVRKANCLFASFPGVEISQKIVNVQGKQNGREHAPLPYAVGNLKRGRKGLPPLDSHGLSLVPSQEETG